MPQFSASQPARSDERIRVAFCINGLDLGGTELNAVRTAERLDRSRVDLQAVLLGDEGPLLERYVAAGVPVHRFRIHGLARPGTLRQGVRLARFLREQRIDVLHAHDVYSNVFAVGWARAAGVPAIASRRWWNTFPRPSLRLANRLAYGAASAVLANSEAVGRLVMEEEGVPADKVAVVRNFLDDSAFERIAGSPRTERLAELGIAPGATVIGSVGNLRPVKDHATLLRAFAQIATRWPEARLVVVGEGECRPELEQLARVLGVAERVHLPGRLPNQPNLHGLFDVSVQCSISEGLPNSALEAMAVGNPVVATAVGATTDAVADGETGLVIAPGRPELLAGALERLLGDPSLARSMGEAGRARARARYSDAPALADLESLYRRLSPRGLSSRRSIGAAVATTT